VDRYCCSLLALDAEVKDVITWLLEYVLPCDFDRSYCLTHHERDCHANMVRERAKALLLEGSQD
jgi:hypothetical protein